MAARKADGLAPATRRQMSGAATISDFSRGRLIHFSLLFHRPCRPCNGDGNRQWESLKHLWIFLLFRFILFLDFYDFSIFIASLSHLFSIFSPKQEVDLLFFFCKDRRVRFHFPTGKLTRAIPDFIYRQTTTDESTFWNHFSFNAVSISNSTDIFINQLIFGLVLSFFDSIYPFIHLSVWDVLVVNAINWITPDDNPQKQNHSSQNRRSSQLLIASAILFLFLFSLFFKIFFKP